VERNEREVKGRCLHRFDLLSPCQLILSKQPPPLFINMTYLDQTKDKHCLFSLPSKELLSTAIHVLPNDPPLAKDILSKDKFIRNSTVLWVDKINRTPVSMATHRFRTPTKIITNRHLKSLLCLLLLRLIDGIPSTNHCYLFKLFLLIYFSLLGWAGCMRRLTPRPKL